MYGKENAPDEYADYLIMKQMKWDWETYLRQPNWLVEMIIGFINAERESQKKELKKQK